ncbi:centrosomal protein of 44 kDa isoform X2 [Hippoglossus hippoglossus]|uniref:centrosomal protein of 44 kDa isoform X2 n=1 Tax=Hippoglossus hippoglossus TaxID=8267 RepID=UPI00148D7481|nr:centrosomal protein of 44 kDa isoform X2 [Hippoglossus hippoglossus]
MLSTGDVQGCLRKLESLLRVIRYPGYVDYNGLSKGDPSAFLPIVSFTLTSFSPPLAEQLMSAGLELTGKTDLRFTDKLYKVLRDIFHYKPILTKQQFLQWGFSQRKISVICDVINLVLQKHNQLKKPRGRCPGSHKDGRGEAHPTLTDVGSVSRSFGMTLIENPSTFPTNSSHKVTSTSNHNEVYSTTSPENGIPELTEGKDDKDIMLHLSVVDRRLLAMETQLKNTLSGLDRLNVLEKRLEELERGRKTDKTGEEFLTISSTSWENLMSRVLLLESKLELSNPQLNAAQPCPSSSTSNSTPDSSKEVLTDRLESITNMLKTTSNLLKNTEPFTTSC